MALVSVWIYGKHGCTCGRAENHRSQKRQPNPGMWNTPYINYLANRVSDYPNVKDAAIYLVNSTTQLIHTFSAHTDTIDLTCTDTETDDDEPVRALTRELCIQWAPKIEPPSRWATPELHDLIDKAVSPTPDCRTGSILVATRQLAGNINNIATCIQRQLRTEKNEKQNEHAGNQNIGTNRSKYRTP